MMITANNGFIEQSERYAFNNAGESLKKYILLKKGELAYNHGASKLRPYGSCFALTTAENARIPFVYHCFSAENQNAEFMSIELNGAEIENQLRKIVSSGARMDGLLNISFDEYTSVSVLLPGTEEQDRIADFFRHLDNLITLHQRKYLQKKKTSLTWKQCKLEDVMDTVTDYVAAGSFEDIRNNVTYLNEPGYAQLVRTVDLKKKFTNNDSVYVDESAFKYLWRVNLNDECIVLPNIGANIGEVYFVEPSGLPYDNNVLGPNAILLKANEDTYFAFTALNNLTFQKQLFENVGSSGQPKFNKTELKSIQLYMPQNEEQVKIEQYFRQLDHLITLHRRAHFHRRRRTYK